MVEQVTTTREINRAIRKQLISTHLIRIGGLSGQSSVAAGVGNGARITVTGSAGNFFGAANYDAVITLKGSAERFLGDTLMGGAIVVLGDAGYGVGTLMQGGAIIIQGTVGPRAGQFAQGGALLVAGTADELAGFGMAGGDLVLCGGCTGEVGGFMSGGRIYLTGKVICGPNAREARMSRKDMERVNTYLDHYGLEAKDEFHKVVSSGEMSIPFALSKRETAPGLPFAGVEIRPARIPKQLPLDGFREAAQIKTMVGEGRTDKPLVMDHPFFVDMPPLEIMGDEAYTDLALTLLESSIPIIIGPRLPRRADVERVIEVAESRSVPYLLDWGELRRGFFPELIDHASAIVTDLTRGVGGGGGYLLRGKDSTTIVPPTIPELNRPEDLASVIEHLRELTLWERPIIVRVSATMPQEQVRFAVESGADAVLLDRARSPPYIEGGLAASRIETAFMATIRAFRDTGARKKGVTLLAALDYVDGPGAFKAIAMGADMVGVSEGALHLALCPGCERCPVGIPRELPQITIDGPVTERIRGYFRNLREELAALCSITGHREITNLNPLDLYAVDEECASTTGLPLLGFERRLPMWEH